MTKNSHETIDKKMIFDDDEPSAPRETGNSYLEGNLNSGLRPLDASDQNEVDPSGVERRSIGAEAVRERGQSEDSGHSLNTVSYYILNARVNT